MTIDYKKELENAAKNMILVHEPRTLIRMIVRTVVLKVRVVYAGLLIHQNDENDQDTYILTVSRGSLGNKIPAGFARMDADNPVIRFFRERKDKLIINKKAIIYSQTQEILATNPPESIATLLTQVLSQMDMFNAVVCIPCYFREELLAILLLGKKKIEAPFADEEIDFLIALASDVAMAMRNAILFKQLENELDKRQQLFMNTTIALATAIEAKDNYTHGHTERVRDISKAIARKLLENNIPGIEEKDLKDLEIAALLHDIGKIGVPEAILNKEGPLTNEEWEKMKTHPTIGANIIQRISELKTAILGVKYHHERYDGSGYPEGLKAGAIPLIASIIAVADSFDAMTTNRAYRKAKSKDEAIKEISNLAGRQFHPLISAVFLQLCSESKI